MKIWLNGSIEDADRAGISPADRGFTLGDGVFETLQVRDGAALRLDAHLARLRRGASVIGLSLPRMDYAGAVAATLEANGLREAALRLTLTRGPAPRGVLPPANPTPTLLISAGSLPELTPVRLVLARVTRRNEFSPLASIKSLNYLDSILARQEAAARGADDAVMLNTQGRLAETTMANLFLVMNDALVTPPVRDGALPGIMRAEVLRAGAEERSLLPGDMAGAREVFITTSLGIRSVDEVEGRPLGDFTVATRMRAAIG